MKAWVFELNGRYFDYIQDGFTAALNNATLYSEKEDDKVFEHVPEVNFVPVEICLVN